MDGHGGGSGKVGGGAALRKHCGGVQWDGGELAVICKAPQSLQ